MSNFSVVAIVLEDLEILRRFVDYYRRLGAERIYLFYDGTPPEALAFDDPSVEVIACDAAYWSGRGIEKPNVFFDRQNEIYADCSDRCDSDWLLVVDANEFVFGDAPVSELLAGVPDDVLSINLPTAEAVYMPGEDIDAPFGSVTFRLTMSPRLWRWVRHVYGPVGPYFKLGVIGHTMGKQFVRPRIPGLVIGPHVSTLDGEDASRPARAFAPPGKRFLVAHFDAICFERWKMKWRLRTEGHTTHATMRGMRARQLDEVMAALQTGEEDARRLFWRYYGLSRGQAFVLRALGKLLRRNIFAAR
jgi:hypothetical protein